MKKSILVILIVGLVLAVGAGVYYFRAARLSMDSILPRGAVMYVRISDIEKDLKEFQSTKLWRNVRDIDVETLMKKSGFGEVGIENYVFLKTQLSTALTGLFLNKFFGQEVALAVYRPEIGSSGPESLLGALSNIILVTRIKPEANFIEFISTLYNKFNRTVDARTEKYKGHTVTSVPLSKNFNIVYVKIKDLLVVGFDKKAAYACVDVFTRSKAPMAQDENYISVKNQLPPKAHLVAYANPEPILTDIRRWVEVLSKGKMEDKKRNDIQAALYNMAGVKTLGFASVPGTLAQGKAILILDSNAAGSEWLKAYSCKPQKNNTLNLVPKEAITYQWSNCFDAKDIWGRMQKAMAEKDKKSSDGLSAQDRLKDLETRLGISMERDIIPVLGDEVGGFLYDIDTHGFFPVPQFALFVKINDQAAALRVIDILTSGAAALIQSEDYKNVKIRYLSLPLGTVVQPGFCFLGDYLLVSSSRDVLRKSVDASGDRSASLASNESLKTVDLGLADKSNSVSFIKTDELLRKVRGLCEWGVGALSLRAAGMEAYQSGMKKKISDIIQERQQKQKQVTETEAKIKSLSDEIAGGTAQGLDVSARKLELTALEVQVKTLPEDIKLSEQKQKELEKTLADSQKHAIDSALVKLYFDKALYPILEGLEINRATAFRMVVNGNTVEMRSLSHIAE